MVNVEIEKFWDKFETIYKPTENIQTIQINNLSITFKDFYDYIATIDYKFECCKIYLDRIIKQYDLDLKKVERDPAELLKLKVSTEFLSWIDCFLFQTKSCLDVIAQVVNLIYDMGIPSSRVNIFPVVEQFPDKSNPFYLKLKMHRDNWIWQFNKYRKFITHHKLLSTGSNLNFGKGVKANFTPHTLPDDPFVTPKTYKLKINLKDFFDGCHGDTLKIILALYEEMEKLLES